MILEMGDTDLLDTINSLPMGVVLLRIETDNRFALRAINDAAKAFFQTDEDPIGRTIQEWKFRPEILERMQRNCSRCVTTKRVIVVENQFPLRDGTSIWSSTTVVPINDVAGNVTGLFVTTIDITELVIARRARERELASLASGFVIMCAWCNSIKEEDRWVAVDEYLIAHPTDKADTVVCPSCSTKTS